MAMHVNNLVTDQRGNDVAADAEGSSREVEAPIKLVEPTPLEAPLAPPPQAPWPGARHKVSSASSVAEHIEQEAARAVHAERHRIAHGNVSFHNASEITTASGRLASSVYPMDTRDCCTAIILTLLAFAAGKFWGRLMLGWTVLTYALRNIYSLTEEAYEITIVMVAIAYASFLLLKKHLI